MQSIFKYDKICVKHSKLTFWANLSNSDWLVIAEETPIAPVLLKSATKYNQINHLQYQL